jgi:cellulose synthase/poly-beta-1,6-N-acetylglucosamine synthase-like glycosyltransferase
MTATERFLLLLYGFIVAAWPVRHVVLSWVFRQFDILTLDSPSYCESDPPLVTAIIPAKDEQTTLPACLDSVRAQTYPALEILIVDDRSTDGTAAIARSAEAEDPRVRLISIDDLPPGWTGKTHALHVASSDAQGDWFWFLDADTRHAPDSLAIVMEYARRHRAALASLVPEMRCETFWERVVQPLAGIVLMRSFPLFLVNRDTSQHAFANGQYILVRRDAYEESGGHEAVRDRFVEDIYMAKRIKSLGYPIRVALSTEISSTRMYTSLPQIVRGWSRILYDALGRKTVPLAGKIIEPLVFSQTVLLALPAALIMLATGTGVLFATWLLALALLHLVLQISVLYRMYRLSSPRTGWSAIWYPLAGLVSDWILFKAIAMCLTGRVTWRGTVYGRPAPSKPVVAETAPHV